MKRKYIEPEQIFVKFNVRDIVITSGPGVESAEVTSEDLDLEDQK